MLGAAITVACLTTSIGLVTSCGEYFSNLLPKLSYKMVVTLVTLFSFIISNFGLAHIIAFSVPVLTAIYPLAIVIIVLSLADKWLGHRRPVYVLTLILTGCVSLFDGLAAAKLPIGPVKDLFQTILPLYDLGIGWIVPAILGIVIGFVISLFTSSASEERQKQAS